MTSFDTNPSHYLPHRSPMLLIDSVIAVENDSVHCRVTVSDQCALFQDPDGFYPNCLFIEFMAQTVGVYAGIRDNKTDAAPRVGFLLGSRNVRLIKEKLSRGDVFDIEARCVFFGEESLPSQFDCRVTENGLEVASAVLTVFRPQNLQQFVQETFTL